ncbi:oligosaccharide flippase family protein [Barrientosiimonas humi]|uniref:oligosaccharide flippase family protein n=1 Tax=Barrientosiimonas humi TaxID=999931 RepID=UPI00370D63C9
MASKPEESVRDASGAALVGLAMTFGNLCAYGFVVLAAQVLEPSRFGEVGAIMGLLLVLGVVSLGLQATAARVVASAGKSSAAIERRALRAGARAALVIVIGGCLLTPLTVLALDLSSPLTSLFAVVAAAELALMGAAAGLLQGLRAWRPFALVQLVYGLGRLGVGGGLVLLWPTAAGAALGVAIGAALPATVAVLLVRARRARSTDGTDPDQRASAGTSAAATAADRHRHADLGLVPVLRGSHLLLALLVLSNVDILLSRSTLTDHQSGLYAAGLIVTKAVLFLPQFVITVAFPDMVERDARKALRITLAAVLGLGVIAVLSVGALSSLALVFVGGQGYAEIRGSLWLFAVLGTVLALVNVLVFRFLATARTGMQWWVWTAVALIVAIGSFTDSPRQLLTVMIAADTALLCVLGWRELGRRRPGVSAPPRARSRPAPH